MSRMSASATREPRYAQPSVFEPSTVSRSGGGETEAVTEPGAAPFGAVALLSGGLDSGTGLGLWLAGSSSAGGAESRADVLCLTFDYGQRSAAAEARGCVIHRAKLASSSRPTLR